MVNAVPKLLIATSTGPQYREIFAREAPELEIKLFAKDDPSLAEFARDVDIVFAWYFAPEILENAPKLRWISSTGAGVDNIVAAKPYLAPGAIATRMVDIFNDSMAKYVLGYLLATTLDVRRVLTQQAAKEWTQFAPPRLRGTTAVVVGLGRIGGEVVRTLQRAGVKVIGVSRSGGAVEGIDEVHPISELDDVLARADALVLVTPLTDDTRGLIDGRRLGCCRATRRWSTSGAGPSSSKMSWSRRSNPASSAAPCWTCSRRSRCRRTARSGPWPT